MKSVPEPRRALPDLLRQQPNAWVSGQTLCAALGVSRAAVWKQVHSLVLHGYTIEARPRMGYRLMAVPEAPLPGEVQPRLTTRRLGRELIWLDSVDSTNRVLGEKAAAGAAEGLVVAADTQTAGRGRLDRVWFSPPGKNLYASILLRPAAPLDRAPSLALLLGLAVRRAVRALAPALDPRLKWPNDLWVDNRKLCGILCDMQAEPDRVHYVAAGIGLNVNTASADFPPEIRASATSLQIAAGRPFPRSEVLAALLNALEPVYRRWEKKGLAPFLNELNEADLLKGRAVTLIQGTRAWSGRADGIAPDGALRLIGADGEITAVYSGDIQVRPIAGLRKERNPS